MHILKIEVANSVRHNLDYNFAVRQRRNTEQWQKRKYKHLECQEGTGHISGITHCVSRFVAPTTWRGCSYVNPQAVKISAMTQGPGCEKEEAPLVPSGYVIFLMAGWPWVTNRRNNDVLGRPEQLLHGGRDGARWEQQPTSLLPTWGTNVQDSHPPTCSEFNLKQKKKQQTQTSQPRACSQATDPIVLPLISAL